MPAAGLHRGSFRLASRVQPVSMSIQPSRRRIRPGEDAVAAA